MFSRPLMIGILVCTSVAFAPNGGFGQSPNPEQVTAGQTQDKSTSNGGKAEQQSWLVRDPTTGRLFQQELVTRTVPTTQWEVRPVPTTVYEPKQVVKTVPKQQVTYTPSTQYVMQPRLKGWWNPLKQPVQAYEFVPVTSWQPQTQIVQQPVTTTQWVARQHIVYVPQAVQRNQTQQQIVSREIPQPAGGYPPSSYAPGSLPTNTLPPATMMAVQQNSLNARPLIAIPLLARQPSTQWNNTPWGTSVSNPIASNGLRPLTSAIAPTYSAPLQTASSGSSQVSRDATQTGMSATVLR